MKLTTRQIIGGVTAVTGTALSIFHLILMIFTDLPRRYHNNELWIAIGAVLAVTGIILLRADKES